MWYIAFFLGLKVLNSDNTYKFSCFRNALLLTLTSFYGGRFEIRLQSLQIEITLPVPLRNLFSPINRSNHHFRKGVRRFLQILLMSSFRLKFQKIFNKLVNSKILNNCKITFLLRTFPLGDILKTILLSYL